MHCRVGMNWKIILLAVVVVGLLGYLYATQVMGIQGFQSGSGVKPNEYAFTMYYADWCGHCKKAKPEFEGLIKKGPITVNGKKCNFQMVSPEKEPSKAKGKPIRGFPTFLLDTPDGQTVEYRGERNTEGYLKFINETLGGGASTIADAAE